MSLSIFGVVDADNSPPLRDSPAPHSSSSRDSSCSSHEGRSIQTTFSRSAADAEIGHDPFADNSAEEAEVHLEAQPPVVDDELVDGFRFLTSRPCGNGQNYRLSHCPMCWEDLEDQNVASHISSHSWRDLKWYQEGYVVPRPGDDRTELIRDATR